MEMDTKGGQTVSCVGQRPYSPSDVMTYDISSDSSDESTKSKLCGKVLCSPGRSESSDDSSSSYEYQWKEAKPAKPPIEPCLTMVNIGLKNIPAVKRERLVITPLKAVCKLLLEDDSPQVLDELRKLGVHHLTAFEANMMTQHAASLLRRGIRDVETVKESKWPEFQRGDEACPVDSLIVSYDALLRTTHKTAEDESGNLNFEMLISDALRNEEESSVVDCSEGSAEPANRENSAGPKSENRADSSQTDKNSNPAEKTLSDVTNSQISDATPVSGNGSRFLMRWRSHSKSVPTGTFKESSRQHANNVKNCLRNQLFPESEDADSEFEGSEVSVKKKRKVSVKRSLRGNGKIPQSRFVDVRNILPHFMKEQDKISRSISALDKTLTIPEVVNSGNDASISVTPHSDAKQRIIKGEEASAITKRPATADNNKGKLSTNNKSKEALRTSHTHSSGRKSKPAKDNVSERKQKARSKQPSDVDSKSSSTENEWAVTDSYTDQAFANDTAITAVSNVDSATQKTRASRPVSIVASKKPARLSSVVVRSVPSPITDNDQNANKLNVTGKSSSRVSNGAGAPSENSARDASSIRPKTSGHRKSRKYDEELRRSDSSSSRADSPSIRKRYSREKDKTANRRLHRQLPIIQRIRDRCQAAANEYDKSVGVDERYHPKQYTDRRVFSVGSQKYNTTGYSRLRLVYDASIYSPISSDEVDFGSATSASSDEGSRRQSSKKTLHRRSGSTTKSQQRSVYDGKSRDLRHAKLQPNITEDKPKYPVKRLAVLDKKDEQSANVTPSVLLNNPSDSSLKANVENLVVSIRRKSGRDVSFIDDQNSHRRTPVRRIENTDLHSSFRNRRRSHSPSVARSVSPRAPRHRPTGRRRSLSPITTRLSRERSSSYYPPRDRNQASFRPYIYPPSHPGFLALSHGHFDASEGGNVRRVTQNAEMCYSTTHHSYQTRVSEREKLGNVGHGPGWRSGNVPIQSIGRSSFVGVNGFKEFSDPLVRNAADIISTSNQCRSKVETIRYDSMHRNGSALEEDQVVIFKNYDPTEWPFRSNGSDTCSSAEDDAGTENFTLGQMTAQLRKRQSYGSNRSSSDEMMKLNSNTGTCDISVHASTPISTVNSQNPCIDNRKLESSDVNKEPYCAQNKTVPDLSSLSHPASQALNASVANADTITVSGSVEYHGRSDFDLPANEYPMKARDKTSPQVDLNIIMDSPCAYEEIPVTTDLDTALPNESNPTQSGKAVPCLPVTNEKQCCKSSNENVSSEDSEGAEAIRFGEEENGIVLGATITIESGMPHVAPLPASKGKNDATSWKKKLLYKAQNAVNFGEADDSPILTKSTVADPLTNNEIVKGKECVHVSTTPQPRVKRAEVGKGRLSGKADSAETTDQQENELERANVTALSPSATTSVCDDNTECESPLVHGAIAVAENALCDQKLTAPGLVAEDQSNTVGCHHDKETEQDLSTNDKCLKTSTENSHEPACTVDNSRSLSATNVLDSHSSCVQTVNPAPETSHKIPDKGLDTTTVVHAGLSCTSKISDAPEVNIGSLSGTNNSRLPGDLVTNAKSRNTECVPPKDIIPSAIPSVSREREVDSVSQYHDTVLNIKVTNMQCDKDPVSSSVSSTRIFSHVTSPITIVNRSSFSPPKGSLSNRQSFRGPQMKIQSSKPKNILSKPWDKPKKVTKTKLTTADVPKDACVEAVSDNLTLTSAEIQHSPKKIAKPLKSILLNRNESPSVVRRAGGNAGTAAIRATETVGQTDVYSDSPNTTKTGSIRGRKRKGVRVGDAKRAVKTKRLNDKQQGTGDDSPMVPKLIEEILENVDSELSTQESKNNSTISQHKNKSRARSSKVSKQSKPRNKGKRRGRLPSISSDEDIMEELNSVVQHPTAERKSSRSENSDNDESDDGLVSFMGIIRDSDKIVPTVPEVKREAESESAHDSINMLSDNEISDTDLNEYSESRSTVITRQNRAAVPELQAQDLTARDKTSREPCETSSVKQVQSSAECSNCNFVQSDPSKGKDSMLQNPDVANEMSATDATRSLKNHVIPLESPPPSIAMQSAGAEQHISDINVRNSTEIRGYEKADGADAEKVSPQSSDTGSLTSNLLTPPTSPTKDDKTESACPPESTEPLDLSRGVNMTASTSTKKGKSQSESSRRKRSSVICPRENQPECQYSAGDNPEFKSASNLIAAAAEIAGVPTSIHSEADGTIAGPFNKEELSSTRTEVEESKSTIADQHKPIPTSKKSSKSKKEPKPLSTRRMPVGKSCHGFLEVCLSCHKDDSKITYSMRRIPYVRALPSLEHENKTLKPSANEDESEASLLGTSCTSKTYVRMRDIICLLKMPGESLYSLTNRCAVELFYPSDYAIKLFRSVYDPVSDSDPIMAKMMMTNWRGEMLQEFLNHMIILDEFLHSMLPRFYSECLDIRSTDVPNFVNVKIFKPILGIGENVVEIFRKPYEYNSILWKMDRHNFAKPSPRQRFCTAAHSTIRKCNNTHDTRYFPGGTQSHQSSTRNSPGVDQNRKTNPRSTVNFIASWSPPSASKGNVDTTNYSVSAQRLQYMRYPQLQDLPRTTNFNTQGPRQDDGTLRVIPTDARLITNNLRPPGEMVQYHGVVRYRGMRSVSNHYDVEQRGATTYLQEAMTTVNHEQNQNYLNSTLAVRYPNASASVPRPPPPYIAPGSINIMESPPAGQRSSATSSTREMKRRLPMSTQGNVDFGSITKKGRPFSGIEMLAEAAASISASDRVTRQSDYGITVNMATGCGKTIRDVDVFEFPGDTEGPLRKSKRIKTAKSVLKNYAAPRRKSNA